MKKFLKVILAISALTLVVAGGILLNLGQKEKTLRKDRAEFHRTEVAPKIESARQTLKENRTNRENSERLEPINLDALTIAQPAIERMNEYNAQMNDILDAKILPRTLVSFSSGLVLLCIATIPSLDRVKQQTQPGEVVNASAAAGKPESHLHD